MTIFLDYLHSHIFIYIVLVVSIAVASSNLIALKEYAAFPLADRVASTTVSRAPFLVMLIPIITAWIWIVLIPIGYGHRDEIAILTSRIYPQIFNGRFFPLGHMEFNVISLSLTDGALEPLYILSFLQLLAAVFLIDRIVAPASALVRICIMAMSFLLALLIPFVNLIIPERNSIFFLLVSIYSIKRYREAPGFLIVSLAVGAAGISLYYKEPMFALWLGIAFGLFCYDVGSLIRYAQTPQGQVGVPRLLGSIQLGLLLSCIFFLLGYIFFVFYKATPDTYYVASGGLAGLSDRLLFFVRDAPLLIVLMLTGVGAHLFIPLNSFERALAVALCMGGTGYLVALIVLSLPLNGYYYSIPILLMVICSGILLKYLAKVIFSTLDWSAGSLLSVGIATIFAVSLVYGIYAVTKNVYNSVRIDIGVKKNYHSEYTFIYSELKALGDIRSIYYVPRTSAYNDYATAVLMIFIHKSGVDNEFDIYSQSGCAVHNESYNNDLIRCFRKDFNNTNGYDVLVIENDSLASVDVSKYHSVKLDLPFKYHDGKLGSITIAKRAN
jgi:hypothetical protein